MEAKFTNNRGAIIITGASTGIGKFCALYLDQLGFKVFAGVRQESDGAKLVEESSHRIIPVIIDITKMETIYNASKKIDALVGEAGIVGLINNAGIVITGPLELLPINLLRKQLDVNIIGHLAVIQQFLPLIKKARGRIINISSVSGKVTFPYLGAYCASKHAMESLTDALRMELSRFGIYVSLIEPGNIKTPIWEKAIKDIDEFLANISSEAIGFYNPDIKGMQKITLKMKDTGISPQYVCNIIRKALLSKKPRTRYIVRFNTHILIFLNRLLPDKFWDKLVLFLIRLKSGS